MSKVKKFFSKVTKFCMDFAIIILTGIEWCIFVGLYSAVELFNKIFKNKQKIYII